MSGEARQEIRSGFPPAWAEDARAGRPGLGDWLDLHALIRRDEGATYDALHHRDRAVGELAAVAKAGPARQLVAWVRAMRRLSEEEKGEPLPGRRTAEAVRLATMGLVLGGFVFGVAAALGAFTFQPLGRINVVALLVVLVGLQWILLVLALLGALPATARRFVPLLGVEREGGGPLQPARWALRFVPAAQRSVLEEAMGRGRAWEKRSAAVRRWLLVSAAQTSAVAFNLGALGIALALVVFSDLSFGWSTTLEVDADTLLAITDTLAWPWARLWPEAVPSRSLVETTRYFRIAAQPAPGVEPAAYGAWWPFVVMVLGVYGLGPRVLFLVFAQWKLGAALARAMVELPGSRRVLERLEAPLVETAAPSLNERSTQEGASGEAGRGALPGRAVVLDWADAFEGAPPDLALAVDERFSAGGRRPADEDERAANATARRAIDRDLPVVVAVRGFEPPLLELLDLLGSLRRALGEGREILVLPIGGGEREHGAWRRKLGALGDPWLRWTGA